MAAITDNTPTSVSRWWILVLVHASVLAFALNLQMIPPLIPRLVSEMGLSHAAAGILMGLFTLPGIFLAIPGGRVADILGPRSVALWSLALLACGTFLMLPLHPGFLFVGRLCSGIGGAVIVVVAPQIVARSFHGRELGLAMGIFNTAVPLGTILAFNLLGFLGSRFGIPVVFMTAASFTMVALAAFFLTYADAPRATAGPAPSRPARLKNLGPGIWLVSLTWVLFNIAILAFFTYAIDYYTSGGMGANQARFLTSLPMLLSVLLTPAAGLVIHRYGFRLALIFTGCVLSSVAIYFILTPVQAQIVAWTVILGAGISLVPPAVFTMAGEVVDPSSVGTGFGLLTTIFNLGVFLGVPLIGYARDLTQNYRVSFILMAAIMASGAVVAGASHRLLSK